MTKTGRVGGSVFRIRYGETIESQYQPVVLNPNTTKQVESRAKLKLASQLAAVMAPVIAMPRNGSISSRNMFIKANYNAMNYAEGQADVELGQVKLTRSVVSLPGLTATRVGSTISVSLNNNATVDRMVYAIFVKQTDNTLRYLASRVVNEKGSEGKFEAQITVSNQPVVVYAYGIHDNNEAATAVFGDMQVVSAETIAKLIVLRTVKETDITLTETVYAMIPIE